MKKIFLYLLIFNAKQSYTMISQASRFATQNAVKYIANIKKKISSNSLSTENLINFIKNYASMTKQDKTYIRQELGTDFSFITSQLSSQIVPIIEHHSDKPGTIEAKFYFIEIDTDNPIAHIRLERNLSSHGPSEDKKAYSLYKAYMNNFNTLYMDYITVNPKYQGLNLPEIITQMTLDELANEDYEYLITYPVNEKVLSYHKKLKFDENTIGMNQINILKLKPKNQSTYEEGHNIKSL